MKDPRAIKIADVQLLPRFLTLVENHQRLFPQSHGYRNAFALDFMFSLTHIPQDVFQRLCTTRATCLPLLNEISLTHRLQSSRAWTRLLAFLPPRLRVLRLMRAYSIVSADRFFSSKANDDLSGRHLASNTPPSNSAARLEHDHFPLSPKAQHRL